MSIMGDALKKVAGNQLELVLYNLTSTPIKGVLLGTGVTAVIQSSSATSVMVVGFVNSGMMKVNQAIGIVLGAILGTSVTGWVLCLSNLSGGGWVALLSTSTLTALMATIGTLLRMISRKQTTRHVGEILLGFAVLMYGMTAMSGAVEPLRESAVFINAMTSFANPLLGILVGIVFTSVIQSASAAVGILQALAATGAVTFEIALPIIMGIAIGAAVPVLLSALGANVSGKRTAFVYLLIDVLGVVIWGCIFYAVNAVVHFDFMDTTMTTVSIALANTLFRLATVVALMPPHRTAGEAGMYAGAGRLREQPGAPEDGPSGGALPAAPGAGHRAEPSGHRRHGSVRHGESAGRHGAGASVQRQGLPGRGGDGVHRGPL